MKRFEKLLCFTILSFTLLGVAACQPNSDVTPNQTPPAVTADPLAVTSATADPTPDPMASPDEDRQLVIWAPDFFSRQRESSSDRTIDATLTLFEQNHPNVRIEVQTKTTSGETSAFSYLQNAQRVAPDILPDVVLLNVDELWQVADRGIVAPLSEEEAALMADFYPFAQEAVSYNGEQWGIPYAADMVHLAYQESSVVRAPATWAELLDAGHSYLFPAGSRDSYSNTSVLLQYIGAGGELREDGTVSNPDALEAVFEFYLDGIARGVFPPEIEQYAGLPSIWPDFVAGRADMADASATFLLSESDPVLEIGYAASPTLSGSTVTIADTWAFAILTQDPEQRFLALELIAALTEPATHGEWSQFVHRLPTQRAAFDVWSSGNDYFAFLRDELVTAAVAQPNGRLYAEFSIRLQEALRSVLNGSLTPGEAVLEVRTGP